MAQFDEYSREDDLGRAVRAAYEAMGPAKEAQERMLAGLRDVYKRQALARAFACRI